MLFGPIICRQGYFKGNSIICYKGHFSYISNVRTISKSARGFILSQTNAFGLLIYGLCSAKNKVIKLDIALRFYNISITFSHYTYLISLSSPYIPFKY